MKRAIITIVDDNEVEMWTVLTYEGGAQLHPVDPSNTVDRFEEQYAGLVELSDHLYELLATAQDAERWQPKEDS